MSNKALFKAFIHQKLGPLSFNRARVSDNPILTAIDQIETASSNESRPHIDTILSLGCLKQKSADSLQQDTEAATLNNILEKRLTKSQQSAYIRVDVEANQIPKVDDLKCIDRLQKHVQQKIRPEEVQEIAARLFASLFYVDINDNTAESVDNRTLVKSR
jgi:hypothetical protein